MKLRKLEGLISQKPVKTFTPAAGEKARQSKVEVPLDKFVSRSRPKTFRELTFSNKIKSALKIGVVTAFGILGGTAAGMVGGVTGAVVLGATAAVTVGYIGGLLGEHLSHEGSGGREADNVIKGGIIGTIAGGIGGVSLGTVALAGAPLVGAVSAGVVGYILGKEIAQRSYAR